MTLLVTDDIYLLHEAEGHPECPERVRAIRRHLEVSGLWDRVTHLPARDATDDEILGVHTPAHLGRIRALARRAPAWIDADTYVNEHSLSAAVRAAGGVLAACEALLDRRDTTAFCLVRPPGHHATSDAAMGFCLFNNVAIAAKRIPFRVLIVDWDVHHGNGTQEIFQNDPSVFYLSTHRWPFYPGTGREEERGCGNVLNVPMPAEIAAGEFLGRFERAVIEAAASFHPEFVLVSCGFDAYEKDPIGGLGLSPEDYGALTRLLRKAAPVPLVSVLEGGYALDALGRCAEEHLKALL